MKVVIQFYDDSICELDVNPDDSVLSVKTQIKKRKGHLINRQKLFFNKIEMVNDKKLKDYSVINGSTLILRDGGFGTLAILKPPVGRPIEIEMIPSTTIKDIKEEIYKLRGIPPCNQQIISINNEKTKDSDLAIEELTAYSQRKLIIPQENTIKIFVKPQDSDPIQLIVEKNTSIDDIKYEIAERINKEHSARDLFLDGIKLEDNKPMKDYLIHDNATLDIIFYERDGFIIIIENTGKFIPLEVTPKDSVSDVKKQIEKLQGIPINQQILVFNGKTLLDQEQLQNYRIFSFAPIELKKKSNAQVNVQNSMAHSFSLKPKQFLITVTLEGKDSLVFDASETDFIREFKLKIQETFDIPVYKQELQYELQILKDEDSFLAHHITDDVTLKLLLLKSGGFFVFVKTYTDNYIPIEITNDDSTSNIKNELQKKGIPIDNIHFLKESYTSGDIVKYYYSQADSIPIFIQFLSRKRILLEISPNMSIDEFRKIIKYIYEIPTYKMWIVFNRSVLSVGHTIGDYNIKKGSTIFVHPKLLGG